MPLAGGAWQEALPHARRRPEDQVGFIDQRTRAIFGRSYAAESDALIEQLRKDEAIAEADTSLLTVPNQLGVAYCAHAIEAILTHVAPALGGAEGAADCAIKPVGDQRRAFEGPLGVGFDRSGSVKPRANSLSRSRKERMPKAISGRSLSSREDVLFGVMPKRGRSSSDDGMALSWKVSFLLLIGSRLLEDSPRQRLMLDQPSEHLIILPQPLFRKGQQRDGRR